MCRSASSKSRRSAPVSMLGSVRTQLARKQLGVLGPQTLALALLAFFGVGVPTGNLAAQEGARGGASPTVSIDAPATGLSNDPTPQIVITYAEGGVGLDLRSLDIRVDGVTITAICDVTTTRATCLSPALADGEHTLAASVRDLVGQEATARQVFTVDATPPTLDAKILGSRIFADGFESGNLDGWAADPPEPAMLAFSETALEARVSYADAVAGVDLASLTIQLDGVEILASCTVGAARATCKLPSLSEGMHVLTAAVRDLAGGMSPVTLSFVVDLTPPTILATVDPPVNAAGWHRSPVTVSFTCDDALSGVVRCPEPATVNAEGVGQLVRATVSDVAGHRASIEVAVSIDLTPPVFDPSALQPASCPSITPDFAAPVRACFSDALSGADASTLELRIDGVDRLTEATVAEGCVVLNPAARHTAGEHQAVATVADLAGNASSVEWCFNIASPDLEIAITSPDEGFQTRDATVDVAGTVDAEAESVTVNGVAATLAGGTFEALGVALEEGGNALEAVATNPAGAQGRAFVDVARDSTPPEILARVEPPANGAGWHTDDATVTFECTDGLAGLATCSDPVVVRDEGAAQEVVGTGTDVLGNTAELVATVNLDRAPPTIAAAVDPPANAAGWHAIAPTVRFVCDDTLSGIAFCSDPVTVSTAGAEQIIAGTVVDLAGHTAAAETRVSVDLEAPIFDPAQLRPAPSPAATTDVQPQVRACFADAISGVDPTSVTLTIDGVDQTASAVIADGCASFDPPTPFSPGEHRAEVGVTDQAGLRDVVRWTFEIALPAIGISIETPATNLLTADPAVDVTGTVESGVESVEVNGVAAQIDGTSFTALAVPLREGRNVITAVARAAGGANGSASVVVLRDTTAPRLRMETPRDGAVLTSLQVDVAGLVNDLIAGTTINADDCDVTVNGVEAQVANRSFLVPDLLLTRGPNTLTAIATDRLGNRSTTSIDVVVEDRAGQRIVLLAGNNQAGEIFEELADPLIVALEDANGDPVTGRPVSFRVSRGTGNLSAFPEEGTEITVLTDDLGQASVLYALGSRSGAGNNRVLATAPGFLGEVEFCATAATGAPARLVAQAGDQQRGAVGEPLPRPLGVLVTDAGGNPVGGVDVTFEVERGGGSLAGAVSAVRTTDLDGLAQVVWTLGPEPGLGNNAARASFDGLAEEAAVLTASADRAGAVEDTRIHGVVLDNQDVPVPGVTVTVPGTAFLAITDAEGQFTLAGVPVGTVTLHVDGSTVSRPGTWPSLSVEVATVAGRESTFGRPIYLLPLDLERTAPASSNVDVTLPLANVPGAELTVFANSVTCPDGSTNCEISVTQVRGERVPMEPPLGSTFMLAWTIQPSGATFDPPARICIPNADLAPGQQAEVFSFDHDQGEFIAVGTATVTDDGSRLCSDPGFGVVEAGWHGCAPPPPPCSSVCTACPDFDFGESFLTGLPAGNTLTAAPGVTPNVGAPVTSCRRRVQSENGCGGCLCQVVDEPDGTPCDDGRVCTADDACRAGVCVGTELGLFEILSAPNTLTLGEDLEASYLIRQETSVPFDAAEFQVVNKKGTVIFKQAISTAQFASQNVTWPGGKWNQSPHVGAFANPNNNSHQLKFVGFKGSQECTSSSQQLRTQLVLEADLRDDIPAGATPTEASGLGDLLKALKIVFKDGEAETVFSGTAITVTGTSRHVKHIKLDGLGLQSLKNGNYQVLFRDLRDEVGNFVDIDGNPSNGVQPIMFPLPLF